MTANIAIAQLMLSALLVSVTFIWGIFRYRRADYHRRDRYKKLQAYLLWGLSGLITISTFYPLSFLYTEHLWSENLGVADVFWGLHKIRWGFFALCFIVAAGFMNINAAIANILCPESREFRRWTHIRTFSFHRTVIGITIVLGLLMAAPMLLLDDIVLRYLHQPSAEVAAVAGKPDVAAPDGEAGAAAVPVEAGLHFGKDRNFYLFSYPMHKWMSLWIQILLWVTVHRCRVAVQFLLPSGCTHDGACETAYHFPWNGTVAVVAAREWVAELCGFVGQGLHETVDSRAAEAPRHVLCRLPPCRCDADLLWRAGRHCHCYRV